MVEYPQSYYAATAHQLACCPSVNGALQADIVVIGAGFTGLSAALSAAEAGYSVILIEAKRIGWAASGRNGGQLIPGMRWSANDLVDTFGEDHARSLLLLGMEATDRVRGRIARHAIDCDLRDGHFHAAWKRSHFDEMRRELDTLHRLIGYQGARLIARADVHNIVASDKYYGGIFDTNGGHFHPLNYALGLARAAQAAGVQIYENSPALSVDHHGPVTVVTPGGRITAEHGILACDSDIGTIEPELGQMMMPVINYNIATRPLSIAEAAAIIPSNASIAESRFVLNYFRLTADNRLLFGGGEKYSPKPPASIADFVRPYMQQIFPHLKGIEIDYGWGGTIGVTLNRLPHFGRKGNSVFAQGFSGHGALLTTLAGELMVEAIAGNNMRFDLIADLPTRKFPGGAAMRGPLYLAGMLFYAMRDRL